jgi:ATP-binding cassette subfamily B protein
VDMTLGPGEIVALVGANGSGKTTLAKLFAGLYPPGSGRLLLGAAAVEGHDALRRNTTVVFQDFARYKLSALDNIAFGRPDRPVDLEGIERAARQAGAHAFVEALPNGYDTVLGKEFAGGVDLSGGQWQRLALARAFYRNSALVILDEPTAALDPQAEADLFARIRDLFRGRTVLLISHRFASVRGADRIYVLDRGRIIERGTHDVLMREDGTYARLFQLQAMPYQAGADDPSMPRMVPGLPSVTSTTACA